MANLHHTYILIRSSGAEDDTSAKTYLVWMSLQNGELHSEYNRKKDIRQEKRPLHNQ